MNDQETDFLIKKKLEELFTLCLNNTGIHRDYTDTELAQACFVMNEVLLSKMHDHHKSQCSQEQLEQLAHELGSNLRQTVFLFTGVDLHKTNIFKQE